MTLLTDGGNGNAGTSNSGGGTSGSGDAGGASTSGSSAGTSSAGGSSGSSGGASTWRETLPEEIRGNATISKYSDIGSLAKAHIELQGLVGKKGVFPPGEKATPEQWKEFYKSVGQPDFEKYEVKLPDGKKVNQSVFDGFRKLTHDTGLMPQQAQGILDWFVGQEESSNKTRAESTKAKTVEEHAALKKEWGDGYDKQLGLARLAMKELGGEEFEKYVSESGLGDNTRVVKLLAKAGGLLGEDKIRGDGGGGKFGMTPSEVQTEIDKIRSDLKHPYYDSKHGGHSAALKRMEFLYQKLEA